MGLILHTLGYVLCDVGWSFFPGLDKVPFPAALLSVKLQAIFSWLSRLLFSIDQQRIISELRTVLGSLLPACAYVSGPLLSPCASTLHCNEQRWAPSTSSCSRFSYLLVMSPTRQDRGTAKLA